jgi:hypothetical protein
MRGAWACMLMESKVGLRTRHRGMGEGCYYVFDGTEYLYVDRGQIGMAIFTGKQLHRSDWHAIVEDDLELIAAMEQEAQRHIEQFKEAPDQDLAIAAGYAQGLERAANIVRERSR